MATFTVSNLNDSGAGSLRAAIEASNAAPPGEANTISFTVSGTIVLASNLPAITNPTSIIAGSTDTGTPPSIGLDCNGNAGLVFDVGSQGSQLMGLAVGNATGHGVTLEAGGIILNNNYIGLTLGGAAAGNSGDGVFVAATSSGNQIGYNPEAAVLAACPKMSDSSAVTRNGRKHAVRYPKVGHIFEHKSANIWTLLENGDQLVIRETIDGKQEFFVDNELRLRAVCHSWPLFGRTHVS